MGAASTKAKAASTEHGARTQPCVVVGVIAAPGLARDVTGKIAADLADDLRPPDTGVDWRTELRVDRLVVPPAQTTDILDAARRELLDANWDLGVVVTDLPLRVGCRPVSRQASRTHGIALVSLPILGAVAGEQPPWRPAARLYRALVAAVVAGPTASSHPTSGGSPRRWARRDWRSRRSPRFCSRAAP